DFQFEFNAMIYPDDTTFKIKPKHFEVIGTLGFGSYGVVEKVKHTKTGEFLASKRMTVSLNKKEIENLFEKLAVFKSLRIASEEHNYSNFVVYYYGLLVTLPDTCQVLMELAACDLN
ncbi:MAG: Dual specificity mitogen-activated protein kinase kinase 3, partial [Paramarteilia canceri]